MCCSKKEPHFFSTADDWRKELDAYERLFPWQDGALHFEASTTYTYYPHSSPEVWERLFAYNPDMRILYLVRHPLARITSAYMHSFERGYTDLDFEQALRERPVYLDVTRYATQIRPFIDRFGRDSVRILFFEDLVDRPEQLTEDVLSFLGVDAEVPLEAGNVHANASLGGGRRHHRHRALPFRMLRRVAPPVWRKLTDPSARAFDAPPALSRRSWRQILRNAFARDRRARTPHGPRFESLARSRGMEERGGTRVGRPPQALVATAYKIPHVRELTWGRASALEGVVVPRFGTEPGLRYRRSLRGARAGRRG